MFAYNDMPQFSQYNQGGNMDTESFLNQTSYTAVNVEKLRQESMDIRHIECSIEFMQIGEVDKQMLKHFNLKICTLNLVHL